MAALVARNAGLACLEGDLNARTVMPLLHAGLQLLAQAPQQWTVDMSAVRGVSSAAVALLLEWIKAAQAQQKALHLQNLPETLQPIINISDLAPLFAPLLRPVQ